MRRSASLDERFGRLSQQLALEFPLARMKRPFPRTPPAATGRMALGNSLLFQRSPCLLAASQWIHLFSVAIFLPSFVYALLSLQQVAPRLRLSSFSSNPTLIRSPSDCCHLPASFLRRALHPVLCTHRHHRNLSHH